jgi:hypothetical protein
MALAFCFEPAKPSAPGTTTRASRSIGPASPRWATVALRPNDISVLIPRGSVMLAAGMRIPDVERARRFFETAVGDFEKVLALQHPYLESLPPHPKGELFAALAEGWSRLGEIQKSQLYLTRMVAELPNTPYSAAATARLENPATGVRITCLGCHTK